MMLCITKFEIQGKPRLFDVSSKSMGPYSNSGFTISHNLLPPYCI